MSTYFKSLNKQAGMSLLEGLIAILIFSLGVLALISLQATTVKQVSDAKYRADAGLLADQLLGLMRVSDRSTSTSLQSNFDTTSGASSALTGWKASVTNSLPGITATANQPSVIVTPPAALSDSGSLVTVTIQWIAPSEASNAVPHKYVTTTQIR